MAVGLFYGGPTGPARPKLKLAQARAVQIADLPRWRRCDFYEITPSRFAGNAPGLGPRRLVLRSENSPGGLRHRRLRGIWPRQPRPFFAISMKSTRRSRSENRRLRQRPSKGPGARGGVLEENPPGMEIRGNNFVAFSAL